MNALSNHQTPINEMAHAGNVGIAAAQKQLEKLSSIKDKGQTNHVTMPTRMLNSATGFGHTMPHASPLSSS